MTISRTGGKASAVTKPEAVKARPKDKYKPTDPTIAKTQRDYAGIMTSEQAEAFAASLGRKL